MQFEEEYIYHVYNRGNNLERIFFQEENYYYFLSKIKNEIVPVCNILAYCLLPNHFHFLVQATDKSCELYKSKTEKTLNEQNLSKRLGLVLSSYTQGINNRYNRVGILFQQKTKAKCLNQERSKSDYLTLCFQYIHQNPVVAGLVEKIEDWSYPSFHEFYRQEPDRIYNLDLVHEMINLDWNNFYTQSQSLLESKDLSKIF